MIPPTKETILKYLHICLVPFETEKKYSEMSGGERQRVFLALYLSFMTKVLLLYEPTSALDKSSGKTVTNSFVTKELQRREVCCKARFDMLS